MREAASLHEKETIAPAKELWPGRGRCRLAASLSTGGKPNHCRQQPAAVASDSSADAGVTATAIPRLRQQCKHAWGATSLPATTESIWLCASVAGSVSAWLLATTIAADDAARLSGSADRADAYLPASASIE